MSKPNTALGWIIWLTTWLSLSALLEFFGIYPTEFHRGFADTHTIYFTAVMLPIFLGLFFSTLLEKKQGRLERLGNIKNIKLFVVWAACFAVELIYQKVIWFYAPNFLHTSNASLYFFLNSGVGYLLYGGAFWLWHKSKNGATLISERDTKSQQDESVQTVLNRSLGKYHVVVYENSSYMRQEEMYFIKERFEDHSSAVEECKRIIDDFLAGCDLSTPKAIKEAHESWFAFGDDPAVRPGYFSGADYLRLRCAEAYASWRRGQRGASGVHVQINYPTFGIAILEIEGLPTVIAKIDHYLEKDKSIICETAVPNLALRSIVLELAQNFVQNDHSLLARIESKLISQGWKIRSE